MSDNKTNVSYFFRNKIVIYVIKKLLLVTLRSLKPSLISNAN